MKGRSLIHLKCSILLFIDISNRVSFGGLECRGRDKLRQMSVDEMSNEAWSDSKEEESIH